MAKSQFDETQGQAGSFAFTVAVGTNPFPIFNATLVDSHCDLLWLANLEAVAHDATVSFYDGLNYTAMGVVHLPAAPSATVPSAAEALSAVMPAAQVGILVPVSCAITVALDVAVLVDGAFIAAAVGGRL